jgi:hypothetical protein
MKKTAFKDRTRQFKKLIKQKKKLNNSITLQSSICVDIVKENVNSIIKSFNYCTNFYKNLICIAIDPEDFENKTSANIKKDKTHPNKKDINEEKEHLKKEISDLHEWINSHNKRNTLFKNTCIFGCQYDCIHYQHKKGILTNYLCRMRKLLSMQCKEQTKQNNEKIFEPKQDQIIDFSLNKPIKKLKQCKKNKNELIFYDRELIENIQKSNHKQIINIEKKLQELVPIFEFMNFLVETQGNMLNNLDERVDKIIVDLESSEKYLGKR